MQTIPTWLQQAFIDWLTQRLYLDGGGNYRLHLSRRIAPYNRSLKPLYPHNHDFHTAAHAWLSLWEHVPTAQLNGTQRRRGPRKQEASR